MIPKIGLGTWGLTADTERTVELALQIGYRMIDTASAYVNEREVGRGIAASGIPRDQLTICTKFPVEFAGKEQEILDFSLASLQVEYLDIWLVHGPMPGPALTRTLSHMREAKEAGSVRQVGVSNFSIEQLDWVKRTTGFYPELNQRFLPLDESFDPLVSAHRTRGILPMAHSPFHPLNGEARVNRHESILTTYIAAAVPVVLSSRNPAHLASNLKHANQ